MAIAERLSMNELRHRAQVERSFDAKTPMVLSDESQLVQVAVNLLVNAAHAIPQGDAERQHIKLTTGSTEDGGAFFAVEDTGIGMAPDTVDRMFTPFFKTKSSESGTGLGLAISHGIITSHGGTISVRSTVGDGTTITVELPAAPPEALPDLLAPAAARTEQESNGDRLNFLVLDDDVLVAKSLSRLLRTHRVTIAHSGQEALGKLDGGEIFDVILCDVMMPEMSGPKFFKTLQARADAHAERVVFVTGGTFSPEAELLVANTDLRVIKKPVTKNELQAAIKNVIGRDELGTDV